nr:hypothetical protein HmN_000727800 [Hymenolepis microstoma]CUU98013.1 hypothetical transcript [Hymenolepis microstoma]
MNISLFAVFTLAVFLVPRIQTSSDEEIECQLNDNAGFEEVAERGLAGKILKAKVKNELKKIIGRERK